MKTIYVYLIFPLFILSCSSSHRSINLDDETEIVPQLFSDELVMPPPTQMRYLNSHLLFMTPNVSSCMLIMDEKTKKTVVWGQVGNGPDDFFSISCVGQEGDKMKFYDTNLRKYAEYEVSLQDSVYLKRVETRQINTGSISVLRIHVMSNGMIVGFAGLGSEKMFVLMDENFKEIDRFGDSPVKGLPEDNFIQLHGTFTSYQNKLFFASQPTGYLACFVINANGSVAKQWDKLLTEPLYDVGAWKWAKENKWGFFDVQATEKYVFAAFSGKSLLDKEILPQNILVFTHEGVLIKNIKYKNEYIGRFTLSDNNKLYTIGKDRLMVSELDSWGL
ncbi:MAG: BF3164 family lipoprotein [Bacteroides sp.]|uniref:BF3164 family lipoprotein n=2 Tax=Bacteroides sp. TaxID=29523 RepID=UPI002FC98025